MARFIANLTCAALLFSAAVAATSAQEAQTEEAAKKNGEASAETKPAKGSTHLVKKGPFRIEVELEGIFEAEQTAEVVLRPETWTQFVVEEAVAHGERVEQGDVLVTLDRTKIDEQIRDLEAERALAEINLKQAYENLQILEQSAPLDLTSAERAKKIADEDLKRFVEIGRPLAEKSARFNLESSQHRLEYTQEELRQLQKMYEADDLTEETEEIILTRQRRAVETAQFYLERSKINHEETFQVRLPRQSESLEEAVRHNAVALEKAQTLLPLSLSQGRLELEKNRYKQQKAAEKLRRLQTDRAAMTVKAPTDGIVYYGQCVRGQWNGADSMASKLRRGGTLAANTVFITIVKPRPLAVRAVVKEKQLEHLRDGIEATVTPTGFSAQKLLARVRSVAHVPLKKDSFDAQLTVELGQNAVELMPGMTCKVVCIAYEKPDALAVPTKAVFTDSKFDDRRFVYLVSETGEPVKRYVTLGKKNNDQSEVTEGLSEGDTILLEEPKTD